MLRFLAAFIVLFAGAAAVIAVLPSPPEIAATRPAVAAQRDEAPQPQADHAAVRVVYPASGSAASSATAVTQAVTPVVVPAATPVTQTTTVASLDPPVPAATQVPADATAATAQTASQTVNINTASIDALNQIPGAGHIGRTIASHRPYRSVEELLTKRVVRKAVYDRIKAQVATN